MNLSVSGIIALLGLICIIGGVAGILALVALPGIPLVIFGFVLLIVAAIANGGLR